MEETIFNPVHLIVGNMNKHGGIARYCRELHKGLKEHMPVHLCSFRPPPLASRFTFLEHLPLGVEPDEKRCIYHFTRIMGCALMLWRPVRPAVATVHDLGPLVWRPEWEAARALDRVLFCLSLQGLKHMNRIIANSYTTARSLSSVLGIPAKRIAVVYLGVDHNLFQHIPGARNRLEQRLGILHQPGIFNLLHVGSEAPRKNLGTLLRALAMLREEGVPARLIRVGNSGHPRYRTAFRQEVSRLYLDDVVIILERISDADLPSLYSAADALVMPSLVEGFGLPVLEAMACGTPVVCSNVGALPEVAGDAALQVCPTDVYQLAYAIAAALHDPNLREQLVAKGLKRSRAFTWEKMASQTRLVYEKLLG